MYTNQTWLNAWLTKNSLVVSNTNNSPSLMNGQIRPLLHFFLKGNFCRPSLQISFRKVLLILFLQGKFCSWIQCSYVLSSWTKAPGTLPSRPFIYMCTCAFLWTCALQLCQPSFPVLLFLLWLKFFHLNCTWLHVPVGVFLASHCTLLHLWYICPFQSKWSSPLTQPSLPFLW